MRASVIIPSYQGAARVVATLTALEKQTHRDFEVILVVDGSTDATVDVVRQQKPDLVLHIEEQSNKGRAGARNTGAKLANGKLLVFYDDDMLPDPDSLAKHIAFHDQCAGCILVGNAPQQIESNQSDFNRYRASLSTRWVQPYPDSPHQLQKDNFFMMAANCSMESNVFRQLQGFDEKLNDAEDKEFGIRAFLKNIPLYFDKSNIAWHDESVTCRTYVLRLRQYAAANKTVRSMHPAFFITGASAPSGVRKWAYRWLASPSWVNAIDRETRLSVLPQKIRYRLYDAVTFALSEVYPNVTI